MDVVVDLQLYSAAFTTCFRPTRCCLCWWSVTLHFIYMPEDTGMDPSTRGCWISAVATAAHYSQSSLKREQVWRASGSQTSPAVFLCCYFSVLTEVKAWEIPLNWEKQNKKSLLNILDRMTRQAMLQVLRAGSETGHIECPSMEIEAGIAAFSFSD